MYKQSYHPAGFVIKNCIINSVGIKNSCPQTRRIIRHCPEMLLHICFSKQRAASSQGGHWGRQSFTAAAAVERLLPFSWVMSRHSHFKQQLCQDITQS
jgi:hypothetical protein